MLLFISGILQLYCKASMGQFIFIIPVQLSESPSEWSTNEFSYSCEILDLS